MKCVKCGKEIPSESVFCLFCGRKQVRERSRRVRGNGTGTVFKLPDGKWKAVVTLCYDTNGRRKTRTRQGFTTKKEALAYLSELQNGGAAGREPTLAELWCRWVKTVDYAALSADKRSHYNTAWGRLTALYTRKIGSLRRSDMQEVIDDIGGEYYPKRDAKRVLCALFDFAIQDGLTDKNYAEFVTLPEQPGSRVVAMTEAEVDAIWAAYRRGNGFARLPLIMIYTGMRTGELLRVKAEDIHLAESYIVGGIKTEAGKNRIIPIADIIKPLIREGEPLLKVSESKFYMEFAALKEECGLREEVQPYSCRHTAATAMHRAKIDPAIIKTILGHAKYSTTVDNYIHITPEEVVEAANDTAAHRGK